MTVNTNSVIPLWVNTWNPTLYSSLTSQENWSYTNQGLGWVSFFTNLATTLNSYQAYDRSSEMSTFFFGSYSYVIFNKIYGTDGSKITSLNAQFIYNLNNLVNDIISRPTNYYNDLVEGVIPIEPTSLLMEADIKHISVAVGVESKLIASLSNLGQSTIQNLQISLLFNDIKPVGTSSKASMKTLYLNTFNWGLVFAALNTGSLIIT